MSNRTRSSEITRPGSGSYNKALVLEAFDTLFNKRDYAAAERFWSPNYRPARSRPRASTR